MCQKLGKKHPQYTNRAVNIRDKDGKLRRNWNGTRVITRVYGHNALNAYTDLRDIFDGGVQWREDLKLTKAKEARLERIWRCQAGQRASGPKFGEGWGRRMRSHRQRNNYTVNKRPE